VRTRRTRVSRLPPRLTRHGLSPEPPVQEETEGEVLILDRPRGMAKQAVSGGGGGAGGLSTGGNTITITGQSDAEPRGGKGGGNVTTFNGWNIGGGGGNPGGIGRQQNGTGSASNGQQGTGGTIIIIVNGTFTGTGSNVNAQGASGGSAVQSSGGQAAAGEAVEAVEYAC
jgi:hypothetical protein